MKIDRLIDQPYLNQEEFFYLFRQAKEKDYLKLYNGLSSHTSLLPIMLIKLFNEENKIIKCTSLDESQNFLEISDHSQMIEQYLLTYLYHTATHEANTILDYETYNPLPLSGKLNLLISLGKSSDLLTYLNDKNLAILTRAIQSKKW